jgi:hypothetical protein
MEGLPGDDHAIVPIGGWALWLSGLPEQLGAEVQSSAVFPPVPLAATTLSVSITHAVHESVSPVRSLIDSVAVNVPERTTRGMFVGPIPPEHVIHATAEWTAVGRTVTVNGGVV